MAEIATWSAILNKTGLGKTSNECPTKAELLALNNGKNSNTGKLIVISNATTYGNNECVKLDDINAEQWVYTLEWVDDPSFNAPATGGTYSLGSFNSIRTKYINGLATNISETVPTNIHDGNASWYDINETSRIVHNNTTTNTRYDELLITQFYSNKKLTATFTQAAGSKVYDGPWNYNCQVDKTSFSYSGGQANVTAKTVSRSYTWNGVAGSGGTESQTATSVTVTSPASISGNTITIPSNSDSARSFVVTFNFPTATQHIIIINQEGGQVSYVDHLSIQPTSKTVAGDGETFSVVVDANYDKYINGVYQENISASYSTAEVTEGGSSNITITKTSSGCNITVAANPDENSGRTFKIKFTYDSATPVYLTITQSKAVVRWANLYFRQSFDDTEYSSNSILEFFNKSSSAGSVSFYVKASAIKIINGVAGNEEVLDIDCLVDDSAVSVDVSLVSKLEFKYLITLTYPENTLSESKDYNYRVTNEVNSTTLRGVIHQKAADVYEFYLTDKNGNGKYTDYTYNANPEGERGATLAKLVSTKNGVTTSRSILVQSDTDWCPIHSVDTSSPYTYKALIGSNLGTVARSTYQKWGQNESGKEVILRVSQNKISAKSFNLKLSLAITNGDMNNDEWGLFNGDPSSGASYDYISLAREGIYESSTEGGYIVINDINGGDASVQVGDTIYVAAYNFANGYWDTIDYFVIQQGDNRYTYTHTWSR